MNRELIKKLMRTAVLCTLALCMAALMPVLSAVSAASVCDYDTQYAAALEHLSSSPASFGSVGGEWKILVLARSGHYGTTDSYFNEYYAKIEVMMRNHGSNVINQGKPTENARLVIALSSIGRDARYVAGFDLTQPLTDFDFIKKQGINGILFSLIALDCVQQYQDAGIKQRCVDELLKREIDGGGWAMGGNTPDPDITSMAITALAPYSKANAAVIRGINTLSEIQNDDGGYSSWGADNSESCSQVLVALSTVGIDAATDNRFIKNGRSVLDALLSFQVGNGFSHTEGGLINAMATEQAAYALCAYDRFLNGRADLYDMRDVTFYPIEPSASPIPTVPATAPAITPTPVPDATESIAVATEDLNETQPAYTPSNSIPVQTPNANETGANQSVDPFVTGDAVSGYPSTSAEESTPSATQTPDKGNGDSTWMFFAAILVLAGLAAYIIIAKRKGKH